MTSEKQNPELVGDARNDFSKVKFGFWKIFFRM